LTKDLPNLKKFDFPSLSNEEIIIGVHSSGIQLEEGINTSGGRYYCSNCKKKIHCYVKVDRKTHEAKVHITCKDKICECKCRTHYACKHSAHLHPYGEKCNRIEKELETNPKNEKVFEKLMNKWRKQSEKDTQLVKKTLGRE